MLIKYRIVLSILVIALLFSGGLIIFIKMNNVELITLSRLVSFQKEQDPLFVHNSLMKTGEWVCDRKKVTSKGKESYRWQRAKKLDRAYLPFSVDEVLFTQFNGTTPVILYMTPSKEKYDLIVEEAQKKLSIANKRSLHDRSFIDFIGEGVAIQTGDAEDHYTILVMNKEDYDKGVRFS